MRRGISLYSFQEEYFHGTLTLAQCVQTAVQLGAPGIEIVAEQMVPGYPTVTDAFRNEWRAWMAQWGAIAFALDMNLDTKRFPGRLLTQKEMTDWVKLNLRNAACLGFTHVRANQVTPPEIWNDVLPLVESLQLHVGMELHPPFTFEHPRIQAHLVEMDRLKSDRLGLCIDTGIFEKRISRVKLAYYLRRGAQPRVVSYIEKAYVQGEADATLGDRIEKLSPNATDAILARDVGRMVYTQPQHIIQFKERILWIHAKFYEMLADDVEYAIPFDEIIHALKLCGFDGMICSEYEGNRYLQDLGAVDSVEQVRRQQRMLARLIAEEA